MSIVDCETKESLVPSLRAARNAGSRPMLEPSIGGKWTVPHQCETICRDLMFYGKRREGKRHEWSGQQEQDKDKTRDRSSIFGICGASADGVFLLSARHLLNVDIYLK